MKIIEVSGVNGLGKTKGVEDAPKKIIGMLKDIYSNSAGRGIDFKNIKSEFIDVKNNVPEEDNKFIYKKAFNEFEKGEKCFFLGGDHSVSYSLCRGFFDSCESSGKKPCLIVFDAHPDLMEPVDRKFPTHEEWLRGLIDDGFPIENILLVGARNSDLKEIEFLEKTGIRQVTIDQIQENLEDMTHVIMEFSRHKELYVTIDIDAVDPAFAPGTYYTEVGGLSSTEVIYIFSRMAKMKNLRGIDLVEINPELDNKKEITVRLGAKILSEFL